MADNLSIIQTIIEQHQAIRRNIKLFGGAVSDRESLAALDEVRSGWVPGRADILLEKQKKLRETLEVLVRGLEKHFEYEEKYLPSLLGEFIMRALLLDHSRVRDEIARVREVVAGTRVEGLGPDQVLTAELRIEQAVKSAVHAIEEHAFQEEVVLNMVRRGLEAK